MNAPPKSRKAISKVCRLSRSEEASSEGAGAHANTLTCEDTSLSVTPSSPASNCADISAGKLLGCFGDLQPHEKVVASLESVSADADSLAPARLWSRKFIAFRSIVVRAGRTPPGLSDESSDSTGAEAATGSGADGSTSRPMCLSWKSACERGRRRRRQTAVLEWNSAEYMR
jgi:hypothetical protein